MPAKIFKLTVEIFQVANVDVQKHSSFDRFFIAFLLTAGCVINFHICGMIMIIEKLYLFIKQVHDVAEAILLKPCYFAAKHIQKGASVL